MSTESFLTNRSGTAAEGLSQLITLKETIDAWERLTWKGLPLLNELVNLQLGNDYINQGRKEEYWGDLLKSKSVIEDFSLNSYDLFLKSGRIVDMLLKDYTVLLKKMKKVFSFFDLLLINRLKGYDSCQDEKIDFVNTMGLNQVVKFLREIIEVYEQDLLMRMKLRVDVGSFDDREVLMAVLTLWQGSPFLTRDFEKQIEQFFTYEIKR